MEEDNLSITLSKANNHFALHLHKSFASEKGNIFFSPFSISTALAMLFNGARGDTAREMRHVLGYDTANLSDDQVHKGFENLLTTMNDNPDVYSFAIANALLTQKDFPFLSQYKEDLTKIYRAVAREVDFVKEGIKVVMEINQWVKENTKYKIHEILRSLKPLTLMVLLNAVYFKDVWLHPFHPKFTESRAFYNYGKRIRKKNVPTMYLRREFKFLAKDTFKALELSYKSENVVMLLLLPRKRNGLKDVERNLTLDVINDVQRSLEKKEVEVYLPKFHLEYDNKLNDVLQTLGMKSLFSSVADLSGVSNSKGLLVSDVFHKAVMDVNEDGTETAAITDYIVDCCLTMDDPIFAAEHPFLLLIIDKLSDLILFMGRVEKL